MTDIEIVKDELKDLSSEVKDLGLRFNKLELKISEVYNSLVGNQKLGFYGLVERVEELEATTKRLNSLVNRLLNRAIGFSVGFASIFTIAYELIKYKFFK